MTDYSQLLRNRKERHLFRCRKIVSAKKDNIITCDSKQVISFCSNDYLGLAQHPQVIKAFKNAANEYGVGATSAQVVGGYSVLHQKLEEGLAQFFYKEKALLFSSGYILNVSLLTTLITQSDIILADKLCHASLLDGILASGAVFKRYQHGDSEHLAKLLQKYNGKNSYYNGGCF